MNHELFYVFGTIWAFHTAFFKMVEFYSEEKLKFGGSVGSAFYFITGVVLFLLTMATLIPYLSNHVVFYIK